MAMYAFKGIGANGKPSNGMRDAESPKALRQLLRKDGVVVTHFELSKGGKGKPGAKQAGGLSKEVDLSFLGIGSVTKTEIAAFTRKLATLLKAGIPLAEAFGALVEQAQNVRFKVPLGEVRAAVNEGSALADAMAKHPKIFDELYVSMVRAGEVAGNLDAVLTRLAEFLESQEKLKSKVKSAMIYPMVMLVVGGGIMVILMTSVVPKITSMFTQQGKTLPINTRMLIWTSDFLGKNLLWLILALIIGTFVFVKWSRSKNGQPSWHRILLKLPRVGVLSRTINVSRFSRTLGTMLQSGVPMLRSLDTAKMIMTNVIMRDAVDSAKKAVTEGESLAGTLKKSGEFPADMVHMVAIGERAGQLEQMLDRVASTYESEVETSLGRFTALLEPLMIVIMGGSIAFIVFSILQPIMDMGSLGGPKGK
jgi:general secretion pathway protein F